MRLLIQVEEMMRNFTVEQSLPFCRQWSNLPRAFPTVCSYCEPVKPFSRSMLLCMVLRCFPCSPERDVGFVALNTLSTLRSRKHNLRRKTWLQLLCDPNYGMVMRQLYLGYLGKKTPKNMQDFLRVRRVQVSLLLRKDFWSLRNFLFWKWDGIIRYKIWK